MAKLRNLTNYSSQPVRPVDSYVNDHASLTAEKKMAGNYAGRNSKFCWQYRQLKKKQEDDDFCEKNRQGSKKQKKPGRSPSGAVSEVISTTYSAWLHTYRAECIGGIWVAEGPSANSSNAKRRPDWMAASAAAA